MNELKLEVKEHVAYLTMQRGKANALNTEMIRALKEALETVQHDTSVGGLVLRGQADFFSAGIDLIELYAYDEIQVREFWNLFMETLTTFVAFSKPAIAAINGHSPAGGCVLALCCDYRIMASGNSIIGLNEIPVGIIVPYRIFELYGFWLGSAKAYQFLLEGTLFNPDQAQQVGLVDQVVPPNQLYTQVDRQMKKYLNLNSNTWQQSKRYLRKNLIASFQENTSEVIDHVLSQWWEPSTREMLKTIIQHLKGENG